MDAILELAARQGYVTTAQAMSLGANEHTLGRLTASGRLVRTVRGVYLSAVARSPEEAHALVTRAVLEADPFAAAAHHSALALHGVQLYGVPWNQVHVIDPRRSSRGHRHLHRHVLREGDHLVQVGGLPAASVPLALCQVAARFGMVAGLVAMDHALHRGLCTRDDLTALLDSGRLRRGIRAARRAVALADARAQSPGESRLRAIVADGPFAYDLQANLGGPGAGYEADLLVDGCVVVEFDGEQKYEGAEGRKALVAEKRREDWLRAQGFGFMRCMWSELDYPVAVRRALHGHVLVTRAARAGRAA